MGYPVFYSDIEAKKILNDSPGVRASMIEVFGEEAYSDGMLNRKFIAEKVFNDQNLLNAINGIVHPAVREAFFDWADVQDSDLIFNEAAILFETGSYKHYDLNVLVTAPVSVRIDRVMKRDNVSEEEVVKRMEKQWTDEQKSSLADFSIINDNTTMLIPQVIELLTQLKK